MVDGNLCPLGLRCGNNPTYVADLPPDSTNCADVVVYSSVASFLSPVVSHLSSYGLKVRAFVGSTDPADATTVYGDVLQANITYNTECEFYPGGCPRLFTEHPLLVIVGDADPLIVGYKSFEDEHDRCRRYSCKSDFDITDVDGDGEPEGPVTRIPAETLDDVNRAILAADEFDSGVNVDIGFHLVTLAGDTQDGGYVDAVNLLTDVEEAYRSMGYIPRDMLKESDYPDYYDRVVVGPDVINRGTLELWGIGYTTDSDMWPGAFFVAATLTALGRSSGLSLGCQGVSRAWFTTILFTGLALSRILTDVIQLAQCSLLLSVT